MILINCNYSAASVETEAANENQLSSITVSAVILTIRRTVTVGVSILTGLAAPSSTGRAIALERHASSGNFKKLLSSSISYAITL